MADIDLATQLLKVIAAHDWGWQDDRHDDVITGLACDCGWATSATDGAVDRWKKHRSRAVRMAIEELTEQIRAGDTTATGGETA